MTSEERYLRAETDRLNAKYGSKRDAIYLCGPCATRLRKCTRCARLANEKRLTRAGAILRQ